jgi:hypothetical protein
MNTSPRSVQRWLLLILGTALLGGLTLANYRFAVQAPGGNDFLARWTGARYWLVEGVNPYDDQVGLAAQRMIYGRPANPQRGEDIAAFVYPLPAMLFFAPCGLLPFPMARALWMTILELGLPLLAAFGLMIVGWRPPRWHIALWLIFSVVWYHGFRAVIVGQFAVIEALLMVGALLAIQSHSDAVAGVLLALSISKPQMVILLLPFVLIWAIKSKRGRLVRWTLGSLGVLILASLLLMPDWPVRWLRQLLAYPEYTALGSPVSIAIGLLPRNLPWIAWAVSGGLLIYLFIEWARAMGKGDRWFQWTAALTIVITNLVAMRTATTNYVVMLPALIMVMAALEDRWRMAGRLVGLGLMLLLLLGLWALFIATVQGNVESPWMYLPLPVLTLLGLWWTSWWVRRLPRLPLQSAAAQPGGKRWA